MMWQWHGVGDWGSMGLWMVVWGVVVVLAVALIVWLVAQVARSDRSNRGGGGVDEASAILARRLANGEIDIEEFTRRSEALGAHK